MKNLFDIALANQIKQRIDRLRNDSDPCGEKGEYHSLVTYCPGFRHRVDPKHLGIAQHGGCSLLELAMTSTPVGAAEAESAISPQLDLLRG